MVSSATLPRPFGGQATSPQVPRPAVRAQINSYGKVSEQWLTSHDYAQKAALPRNEPHCAVLRAVMVLVIVFG
jgi:hypothetical protein